MVKTQLRSVRIEGDTPLNASPGQPQICLDFYWDICCAFMLIIVDLSHAFSYGDEYFFQYDL